MSYSHNWRLYELKNLLCNSRPFLDGLRDAIIAKSSDLFIEHMPPISQNLEKFAHLSSFTKAFNSLDLSELEELWGGNRGVLSFIFRHLARERYPMLVAWVCKGDPLIKEAAKVEVLKMPNALGKWSLIKSPSAGLDLELARELNWLPEGYDSFSVYQKKLFRSLTPCGNSAAEQARWRLHAISAISTSIRKKDIPIAKPIIKFVLDDMFAKPGSVAYLDCETHTPFAKWASDLILGSFQRMLLSQRTGGVKSILSRLKGTNSRGLSLSRQIVNDKKYAQLLFTNILERDLLEGITGERIIKCALMESELNG